MLRFFFGLWPTRYRQVVILKSSGISTQRGVEKPTSTRRGDEEGLGRPGGVRPTVTRGDQATPEVWQPASARTRPPRTGACHRDRLVQGQAEWLAFLARNLGVTADYLLFGKGSSGDDLAQRLSDYLRARLRAAGVPEFVLDQSLLDPPELLKQEVEVHLNDLREWETSRQAATRSRLMEEDQETWERPHVPRVPPLTIEQMRTFSEESLRLGGNPDGWTLRHRGGGKR